MAEAGQLSLSQVISSYPKHDNLDWANDVPTAGTRVRLKSAFLGDIRGCVGTGEESESVNGIIIGWHKLLQNEGLMSRIEVTWRAEDTSLSGLSIAAIFDESESIVYGFQSHEVRLPPRPGEWGSVLFYCFFMPHRELKELDTVNIKLNYSI